MSVCKYFFDAVLQLPTIVSFRTLHFTTSIWAYQKRAQIIAGICLDIFFFILKHYGTSRDYRVHEFR